MAGCQVSLVWRGIGIAAHHTARLYRLDLRIPVEQHLVCLEVGGARITGRVRWHDGGDGRELAERVAELGADAVDCFLEPDRLELLRPEVLDHRQQELDTVVVGRQTFFVEEVPELHHVVGMDAEDAERLEHTKVFRLLDAFLELRLAAALET